MEYYFAYGSNMDAGQMRERCPSALFVRTVRMPGWRLTFPRYSRRWMGGVASLEQDPESAVEGVIFRLSPEDLEKLDDYEGVDAGAYHRIRIDLPGKVDVLSEVWTYVAATQEGGPFPSSPDYVARLVAGARQHKLTPGYIAWLERQAP